jgi:predicted MFS family arabinose efflux permease
LISPAFSLNGLIYLVSLAVFVWGLKDLRGRASSRQSRQNSFTHHFSALRSPRIWRFAPAWIAVNSIFGMWMNHSVRLLSGSENYAGQLLVGAYGPREFGNGLAVFLTVFSLGVLLWRIFIVRYRKTTVMLLSVAGLFAILFVVYWMNHLGSFSDPMLYLLMAVLLLGVLVMSGFAPAALVYLADLTEAHAQDRGSIMGLYSVFLGIGQLLGTAAGGVFASWNGIDGLLLLSGILGSITALILVLLRSREAPAEAQLRQPAENPT